jgi:hypothetical protein
MGLPPPTTTHTSEKPLGPLMMLLGGLAFVVVMWGVVLADLLRRLLR